jgi:hypothetical protein
MKNLLFLIAVLTAFAAQGQEDYKIKINDTAISISLDTKYEVLLNGKKVNFTVTANDTVTYNDNLFSFRYLKDYKITKTEIDGGIEQLMLLTAEGSGFLIQRYSSMNPEGIEEMMLKEVTKESIGYGFKQQRNNYQRKLKSGQDVTVIKAVLKYKDETNIYEITSIGKKDEGILVIAMIMDETKSEQGRKTIDLMWNSLFYK